jgi:hypothetical protein
MLYVRGKGHWNSWTTEPVCTLLRRNIPLKVKVKMALEQAMKAQRESIGIVLLFL